ncbi:hypothetical protein BBP40_006089 [Aspergillus hancockii]|nr:hypothetical protein BBP40_006089 [Aspergillus hancockii]
MGPTLDVNFSDENPDVVQNTPDIPKADEAPEYRKAFKSLDRLTCRRIAKEIIERIEPEKKPAELPKHAVVTLLTHIVRKVDHVDLAAATSEYRGQMKLDKKIKILDGIPKIRQAKEPYVRGGVDGSESTSSLDQSVNSKEIEELTKAPSPTHHRPSSPRSL